MDCREPPLCKEGLIVGWSADYGCGFLVPRKLGRTVPVYSLYGYIRDHMINRMRVRAVNNKDIDWSDGGPSIENILAADQGKYSLDRIRECIDAVITDILSSPPPSSHADFDSDFWFAYRKVSKCQEVTCKLCSKQTLYPVVLRPCGHLLCKGCLAEWFGICLPRQTTLIGDRLMYANDTTDGTITFDKQVTVSMCCCSLYTSSTFESYSMQIPSSIDISARARAVLAML